MGGRLYPLLHRCRQFLLSRSLEELSLLDEQLDGTKLLQQTTAAAASPASGAVRPPDELERQKTFEGFDNDGARGHGLAEHRVVVVEFLVLWRGVTIDSGIE